MNMLFSVLPLGVTADFGGYIVRLSIDGQYMSNEDVIIKIVAFRSSSDNKPLKEEVGLKVFLGREVNGSVEEEDYEMKRNATIISSPNSIIVIL